MRNGYNAHGVHLQFCGTARACAGAKESFTYLGRSGPCLEPVTVRVHAIDGLLNGLFIGPCPETVDGAD